MALRVRFQYATGAELSYSIERLADGLSLDFADGTFKAEPGTPTADLPESARPGLYAAILDPTPADRFPDGQYLVTVSEAGAAVAALSDCLRGGDDGPVFPSGAGVDPLGVMLPGGYPPGSYGALIAANLDARVSSRSTYAGGPVDLNLGQPLEKTKAATVGGALAGSFLSAFGKAVKDRAGKLLELFWPGDDAPLATFDLDDPANPSSRTPRP